MTTYLVVIIAVALLFDFINGFHDAANSIATVVSTRVLSPRAAVVWAAAFNFIAFLVFEPNAAVVWAAAFNFIAFLVFEPKVSAAIAKGVTPSAVTNNVLFATLTGAVIWNLLTWWWGLPSSSSHALMGALAGAALANVPDPHILDPSVFGKTFIFIVLAPMLGMVLGYALMMLLRFAFGGWRPSRIDKVFRRGQLLSAALYSLGHGGNDAQKTMGIITALLVAAGIQQRTAHLHPKLWVVLACHAAMGLGTLSGGWRIVKTMGMKITKLRPVGGFCAETAGAMTLAMATFLGVPVSTTHTITGAIVGVGSAENKLSAVRWGVAGRIVWAWIFTIPAAGMMAAVVYWIVRAVTGTA